MQATDLFEKNEKSFSFAQMDSLFLAKKDDLDATSLMIVNLWMSNFYRKSISFNEKILSHAEDALKGATSSPSVDHSIRLPIIKRCIVNIYEAGDLPKWLYLYEQYFDKIIAFTGENIEIQAEIYQLFSLVLSSAGNFEKSKQLSDFAITSLENNGNLHSKLIADLYGQKALIYYNIGEVKNAINFFQKTFFIYENYFQTEINNAKVAEWYSILGECYNADNDGKNGLVYSSKGLEIYRNTQERDTVKLTNFIQSHAESLWVNKQFEESEKLFLECVNLNPKDRSFHYYLANIYLETNQLDKGLNSINSSIKLFNYTSDTSFHTVVNTRTLDKAVSVKAKLLQAKFAQTDSITYLKAASDCHEINRQLSLYNIKLFFEAKNKLAVYQKVVGNNAASLDVLYQLFENTKEYKYLEKMLDVSEMNKSLLLYFSIVQNKITVGDLPQSLLDAERDLRLQINAIENEIFDKGKQISLLEKKLSKTLAYESVRSELIALNEDYAKKSFTNPIESLQAIQSKLPTNTSILEFAFSNKFLFLFVVNHDKFSVYKIDKNEDFNTLIQTFTKKILVSKSKDIIANKNEYLEIAHQLYQKMIAPIENKLKEKVIIITDDYLNQIPFDALLTETTSPELSFNQYPFWLKKHTISYALSGLIFKQKQDKKHDFKQDLLTIAPFCQQTESIDVVLNNVSYSFPALPNTAVEVKNLVGLLNGKSINGSDATKMSCTQSWDEYRYIHIASHSKANFESGEYSYIVFHPSSDTTESPLLFAKDIYQLHLNTEMVVLSSCESGNGEQQKGEGLNSLSRAFSYAGVQNIINSLWKINDAFTQKIMYNFYTEIKNGEEFDDALRKAKLAFISSEKSIGAHPFYWSAFKLIQN